MRRILGAMVLAAGLSCSKVPIYGVEASFKLADASWFAEEQTLFVFYRVKAEQGIGDPSVIEVSYTTDDGRVDWTPIEDFPKVHVHVAVDCGQKQLCGSTSVSVPLEPRNVRIRLRYHEDGELALDAKTTFNVVGPGPPHSHRSLLIYGVFDETNERMQWRSRHQFPTLRNQRATELGLRRNFFIREQRFGRIRQISPGNPYAYGVDCPGSFVDAGLPDLVTNKRAVFSDTDLPIEAYEASGVCAQATVTDANGEFTTGAVGRKNPEVRSAFPVLRSPIRKATEIQFFLGYCDRVVSREHEEMQRQRLFLEDVPTYCIDDWNRPDFVDRLVVELRDAVEAERPMGRDMVLVLALNQDEDGVASKVEEALAAVVPAERHRSSPRLAGAFVFDSDSRGLELDELAKSTLWCPATLSFTELPDASVRSCAAAPDIPDLELGPFSFGALQILPTRPAYLDFIETYSDAQAGEATSLKYLTPEFATTSEHADLGEFGVVSFLNGESIAAEPNDAFSFCVQDDAPLFVVRSNFMKSQAFMNLLQQGCGAGVVPGDLCSVASLRILPMELLPTWHNFFGEDTYELGLFWEFPFLLRMEYEAVIAGSASAFGLSVPFGFASPAESYFGTSMWLDDEFPVDPALTQCTRFCDNPTFGSAGVYHIRDPFRATYANACYLPLYPVFGDSGYPLDP